MYLILFIIILKIKNFNINFLKNFLKYHSNGVYIQLSLLVPCLNDFEMKRD